MWHVMCVSKARLDGKTAVVTGCNSGIGRETAKEFLIRGCRVIMACRDVSKAEEVATEIREETSSVQGVGTLDVVCLDLASLSSVRQCAEQLLRTELYINLLINNAGIGAVVRSLSEDGFELQFAVNYLGHFLLTLLLLPKMLQSTPARIVSVSSCWHIAANIDFTDINLEKSYNTVLAYNRSKLATVLFSNELARRLQGSGVATYALHPGVVNTNMFRHVDETFFPGIQWFVKNVLGVVIKTPLQGAQTSIYCAVAEEVAEHTGLYYSDCKMKQPSAKARGVQLALKLWEESLKMVQMEHKDFISVKVTSRPDFGGTVPVFNRTPRGTVPVFDRTPQGTVPVFDRTPQGTVPVFNRNPQGTVPVFNRNPHEKPHVHRKRKTRKVSPEKWAPQFLK